MHPSAARALSSARAFHVSLFLGRGRYERRTAADLPAARRMARALEARPDNFGRRAMIYVETRDGRHVHIE